MHLFKGGSGPFSISGVYEKSLVIFISGITLVIVLYVVPVDKVSNFFIDSIIPTVGIVLESNEVRGLRSMG